MNRFARLVLGGASVLPLVGLVGALTFLVQFIAAFDAIEQAGDLSPQLVAGGPAYLVYGIWIVPFVTLVLWAFYLLWLIRVPHLDRLRKAAWIIALTLAAPLVMPVLWWRHFRPGADAR